MKKNFKGHGKVSITGSNAVSVIEDSQAQQKREDRNRRIQSVIDSSKHQDKKVDNYIQKIAGKV